MSATIHATALLIDEGALLIRGPAGAGKSSLALSLIREAQNSAVHFVRLIADDRVHVDALPYALLARTPDKLAGMLEERGKGIISLPHELCGIIHAVIDLEENAARVPEERKAEIAGLKVIRFFHPPRTPLPLNLALEIMKKANSCKGL